VLAELRFKKGLPDLATDDHGEGPQVLLARAHENGGPDRAE